MVASRSTMVGTPLPRLHIPISSAPSRQNLPSVSQVGYETAADEHKPSFEDLEDIARFIQEQTSVRPTLGVICGSGLGGLAEDLDQDRPKDVLSYSDIPNFPVCRGTCRQCFFSCVFGNFLQPK